MVGWDGMEQGQDLGVFCGSKLRVRGSGSEGVGGRGGEILGNGGSYIQPLK